MRRQLLSLAIVALAACGRATDHQAPSQKPQVAAVSNEMIVLVPGTGPDARTPLAPVRWTINPKSTEAAEQLVQAFARLLNMRKFDEAYTLLGPNAPPRKAFDEDFASLSALSVTEQRAGDQEGAAGSTYLSIWLTISGMSDGKQVNRSAVAIVRRVNDVPGSTQAQRRWHIERIGLRASD